LINNHNEEIWEDSELVKRLQDLKIEELILLSNKQYHCPYKQCSEYEKYNQCVNHSYVLCPLFEAEYDKRKKVLKDRKV
jgi:hypothetical protein